jgi:membrane protein DedA with SNARE-associated domain
MHAQLMDASVTNSLVNLATHVINDLGLAGVAAMVFMSAIVFVPGTEAPMLFAGFDVFEGHFSLLGIIIAGLVGDLLGASVAYAIGYFGAHEALSSKGILHLDERKLARATDWFGRYGAPAVAVSRCLPLIRAAGPYAAGISQMSYVRCIFATFCGSAVWITGLALLGRGVGADWTKWKSHLDYVDYAVVAIVVVVAAWYGVRWLRARRGTETAGA